MRAFEPFSSAEAVRRRLDVEVRPDRAVDRGEGAEALHHLRIGLVQEIARQAAVVVGVEVAVAQQERQLVRRPFGQLELSLALVAHDPETRETGVDVEARHAHHVVVVPEHRRTLVVRIRVERRLAGGGDVLRPAVARWPASCRRGGGRPSSPTARRLPRRARRRCGPAGTAPALRRPRTRARP